MIPKVAFSNREAVVFFDGVCGLCNGVVNTFIRMDHQGKVKYSTLQGELAKETIPAGRLNEFDTIFYKEGDILYEKSTAVLKILIRIGGVWSIAQVFLWVPLWLRDGVYGWVARNRYKFFGKEDTCRFPTAEERSRFVD